MTRYRITFLFGAALLALTASFAGAAQDPGASIFTAKPALCQADLTPAQQAPANLLGIPAPQPRTCQQDCFNARKACVAACGGLGGDEQCLSDCHDQYEYCMCGACNWCP